jgi:hypothetical protein
VIFTDLPAGASLFIDANTFVYHFSPHATLGAPCTELLERVNRQEISANTSIDVLRDVAHRIMTAEAMTEKDGLSPVSRTDCGSVPMSFNRFRFFANPSTTCHVLASIFSHRQRRSHPQRL